MQLKGHPFDLDVFSFGGLFQRRLRQKAPRSDVVGENQYRYWHSSRFYTPSYLKSAGIILPNVSFSSFASRNPARTIWQSMRLAVLDGEIVCPASAPPQNPKTSFQLPPQSVRGKWLRQAGANVTRDFAPSCRPPIDSIKERFGWLKTIALLRLRNLAVQPV